MLREMRDIWQGILDVHSDGSRERRHVCATMVDMLREAFHAHSVRCGASSESGNRRQEPGDRRLRGRIMCLLTELLPTHNLSFLPNFC